MPQASSAPPAGLAEIDAFVHDCWLREGARPLPMVVLLGRPGSGKTHALDHFEGVTKGGVTARVNFAPLAVQRPYEVALHIAFLLARKHAGMRPPRFPRLMLGLLALDIGDLSLTDHDAARQQLKQALKDARNTGPDLEDAEDVAQTIATLGLSPIPHIGTIAGLLLLLGFKHLPVTRVFKRALESYGEGSAGAGIDALIELNRRSRTGITGDADVVDRRLCEAFTDDLSAAYAGGRYRYNCLALLDNVDRQHAVRFLETLRRLREEKARSGSYDPLLVVATSATARAVPGPCDGGPDDPHVRRPEELSYAAWRPRPEAPPPDWWCPVRLRDLDEVEVTLEAGRYEEDAAEASGLPEPGVLPTATPLVHRLTYGHPWSVRALHDAIAGLPEGRPADEDLRGLLHLRRPDPDGHPLADTIRERLLTGFTDDQRAAALRVAVARTPRAAVNAGLLGGEPEHARDTLMRELRNRLWLARPVPEDAHTRGGRGPSGYLPGAAADDQPVLHPWLRLLLLEALTAGAQERWQALHGQLADWNGRHLQPLDRLYHRLARGELDAVVGHFAGGLAGADLGPWLRELYHVTAAPMYRAQLSDAPPRRRAGELARELAPAAYADRTRGRPLAELCAALWLAGDPRNRLPVGNPELNHKIGAMLRLLAMEADADADTLLEEAVRYTG